MSDQQPDRPTHEHPIVAGLLALVGVAVAIGLVLGVVTAIGTHVLGLGGGAASGAATDQATMYVPRLQHTPSPTAAQITLGPGGQHGGQQGAPGSGHHKPSGSKGGSKSQAAQRISLSASTTAASPMEQFNLSGVYPGGEGAILTVQRFQNGAWADFPATGSVSGGAFQIPVQTSQGGINKFRVVDTDTQRHSNVVRVAIH
jgi:hypothetical protein